MRGLLLAAALMAATPAAAADIDGLYAALASGDNAGMQHYVEEHYREAGASLNELLEWKPQAFDQVVNWYDQYDITITLAVFPADAEEVAAYWQNWSDALSGGTWDWRLFFADAAEAGLLANFNQFVLAAHEYGHALTYRYDWGHEARTGYEINCREYFADRLAAGLIEEVAEADHRFSLLRLRYRALMAEINHAVPEASRYAEASLAELDADCRLMHVEQPTAETMAPYASAFFARQLALMGADLPPLSRMYELYLFPRLAEGRPPASGYAGAVTSERGYEGVSVLSTPSPLKYNSRHFAFAPDGELFAVDISEDPDSDPPRYRFAYGPAKGPIGQAIAVRPLELPWDPDHDSFNLDHALSFGPDRFVVVSSGTGFSSVRPLLFDVRRTAGGSWQAAIHELDPDGHDYVYSRLVFGPDGTLLLYSEEYIPDSANYGKRWVRQQLDPQTFAVLATATLPSLAGSEVVAAGPAGETYFAEDWSIVAVGADGIRLTYAGAGLQGLKDSDDPLEAEFIRPAAFYLEPGGGMRVLDYDHGSTPVIRHIAGASAPQASPLPDEAAPARASRPVRRDW